MVKSLVYNHFNDKATELHKPVTAYDSDLVSGKGKGLIVLLHGAPGVGKTSTAECIAEASGKLLFPITCGDLGLTAAEVERELSEKFHLDELWDCILLLDEADVFLAQRSRTEVARNSLVSVFLRVLEYFTGILFLTTNRVGAFDEAFKSRIHISLYYPPLVWKQTNSIWRMNMERLKAKRERLKEPMKVEEEQIYAYAEQHFRTTAPKRANWNGRQIRNAFQTATALAEFEANEEDKRRKKTSPGVSLAPVVPELKVIHFDRVAWASFQFEKYLSQTHSNFTDAERAYLNEERSDQFRAMNESILRMDNQSGPAYAGGPALPAHRGRPQPPARQHSRTRDAHFPDGSQPSYLMAPYATAHEAMYGQGDDGQYDPSLQETTSSWPTAARVAREDHLGEPTIHGLQQQPRHQHVEQASVISRHSVFEHDGHNKY